MQNLSDTTRKETSSLKRSRSRMSGRIFYNNRGEGRTLAELDVEMNQEARNDGAAAGAGGEERERRKSPRRRSRSPRRDEPNRPPKTQEKGNVKATGA